MKEVVDLERARLDLAAKKAYRNWASKLGESFSSKTKLSHLSVRSLVFLAQGKEKSPFYLYDFIMNLLNLFLFSGKVHECLGITVCCSTLAHYPTAV